jgi:RimJ/RimL family protein N-acetyltransferase
LAALGFYRTVALETPNLVLEPLTVAHADELLPHLADESLYTFVSQDPPPSLAWLRERYTRLERGRSPDGRELWLNWVIRPKSGEAVGTVQATCSPDLTALIAYEIYTPFQRRGLATEAVAAMIDHLRSDVGMKRIGAFVDTRNERSWRLLERLGFKRQRRIENADVFKGATSDEFEYELESSP